ncbi:MAG: M91 family zinc metallopeptidase [Byssovorax sp.]
MPALARVGDTTACPKTTPSPHIEGILANNTPVCAQANGKFVIRLADFADCKAPPRDVVMTGAATVVLCGLPVARVTDKMDHGGTIVTGSPDVEVGGPTFALPSNFTLDGDPDFKNKTLRDLYKLSTTKSGKDLIDRLEKANKPLTIQQHTGTNGYCTPNNGTDAGNGTGTGSLIQYNPDYRSNAFDKDGNMLAQPPTIILGHEMTHALANAEGHQMSGTDPSPPASQTDLEGEEAQAIGTGSHDGETPNENAIRSDLGLGRRDNHYGTGGPKTGEPTPINLRPGDC